VREQVVEIAKDLLGPGAIEADLVNIGINGGEGL
jgi:hypothetical protein